MTHMELENLVSEYLEGRLDAVRRVEVEAHLAGCDPCQELVAATREVLALCRSAEDLEPAPWLVPRILRATIGERKPSLWEQIAAYVRPVLQSRAAYVVAMAVFSFSIIVNAAGINLRRIKLVDLNPRTWFYQANRNGHLLYGRAEKFCYDLKVVYELETRLRQLRPQPDQGTGGEEKETPKPQAPAGGSTEGQQPSAPQLASLETGDWKLETGNWKRESRNSRFGIGNSKLEDRSPLVSTSFEFPVSSFRFRAPVSSPRSITR
jgi:hypothetical protein